VPSEEQKSKPVDTPADPEPEVGDDSSDEGERPSGDNGSPEPDELQTRMLTRIAELEDALAERDRRLREYIAAHQHAVEEMDAARKRMERDRCEEVDRDRSALAGSVLGVLDDLDRSIEGAGSTGNIAALLEGVSLVRNRMMSSLHELGVEPMTSLGERFDPNFHEAVGMIPVPEAEQDQRIIAEEQSGFLFKGKLLRAARVIVGTHTGS